MDLGVADEDAGRLVLRIHKQLFEVDGGEPTAGYQVRLPDDRFHHPPVEFGRARGANAGRARAPGRAVAPVAKARRFARGRGGHACDVIFRRRPSFLVMAWIVVGVVIAAVQDYFDRLDTAGGVASAVVAALLWPLLLLGFDVRISR
jgi:hypothetical protein